MTIVKNKIVGNESKLWHFYTNKQTEDNHFKILCVIFEVTGGNLKKLEVKQLNQMEFGHLSSPKFDTRVHFQSAETPSTPK